MTLKEGRNMAKWKKMMDYTSNPRVYKCAYFAWLEYSLVYRKSEGHRARRGKSDRYKSVRRGKC